MPILTCSPTRRSPSSGIALDLGAYVGNWAKRMAERYGCTVYGFEPSPGPAAKAAEDLQAYPQVTILPYGVGATDCTAALTRDGPGSSIYGGTGQFGTVEVAVRDIVVVLEELDLHSVDVMKINIEGAEYDLLERLFEANWLPRISMLSVQFHEWHPRAHRRRKQIRAMLRRSHEQPGATAGCGSCGSSEPLYPPSRASSSASRASRSFRRAGSFAQFASSPGSASRS